MSACTNATHALSRGLKLRVPRRVQTLPFLYQTATLRRYYSEEGATPGNDRADGPLIRKVMMDDIPAGDSHSSRAPRSTRTFRPTRGPQSGSGFAKARAEEDFIPFEGAESTRSGKRPAGLFKSRKTETDEDFVPFETPEGEESVVPAAPSTLTEPERKTFEKLEAMALRRRKAPRSRKEENFFESLDDVLNEALENVQSVGRTGPEKKRPATEAKSAAISKSKSTGDVEPKVKGAKPNVKASKPEKTEPEPEENETVSEKDRILNLIRASNTDTQVWQVLETELFTPIASLNLDQAPSSAVPRTPAMTPTRRRALMNEFPKHLTAVAFILRVDYPDSNLILSLMPKLRSLGPSVYALGASPKLYNQAIAFLFEKYTDIDGINELLAEMEREVIEPNKVTLRLLDYMDDFRQRVHKGGHGTAIKSVWATEKYKRSFEALGRWRARVERLMAEQEIRVARKNLAKEEMELKESDDKTLIWTYSQ